MNDKPWYQHGLQFQCTQCGDCCTGAPGFVWVNKREIAALSQHFGLSTAEFEERYVRPVGIRKSLREFPNGDCVFFDSRRRKCSVYDVRPRQCRSWPFWDSNLRSPETWEQACEVCPGSGQGRLYSLESIEEQRQLIAI